MGMLNLISPYHRPLGDKLDYMVHHLEKLLAPGQFLHWYGKQEAKPGRKMGHINFIGSYDEKKEELAELEGKIWAFLEHL